MHKIIHPSVMQAMVIVNINGYENVRKGLVELLYGNDNIEVRLDNFRDNVKEPLL